VPAVLKRFLSNYMARHRCRWNQVLHLLGVPMTFVASAVLLALGMGWWALGAFVGGYALQFLGHAVEGNDAGELVLVKRCLGWPYTEFGPGSKRSSSND
jgi:uncharacterized membrane protein YGL010W